LLLLIRILANNTENAKRFSYHTTKERRMGGYSSQKKKQENLQEKVIDTNLIKGNPTDGESVGLAWHGRYR
jgi:hypothetical protein